MPEEIVIPEPGVAPAPGHGLPIGDLIRYITVFEELIGVFNGLHNLAPGGDQPIPEIKIRIGSARYSWKPGDIHRDS